jgi:hypothetical protein
MTVAGIPRENAELRNFGDFLGAEILVNHRRKDQITGVEQPQQNLSLIIANKDISTQSSK